MKTNLLIALFLLLSNSKTFSQLNLVNTESFEGRAGYTVLEGIGEKYFTVSTQRSNENDPYLLKIYNLDHTIYKEINFDFPEGSFSDFTIDCISTRLFNLDDKIEFAVKGDCSGFAVFDEDGDLLFISEEGNACDSEITNTRNGALLFLPINSYPNEKIEIYELPGKICYEYNASTDLKSQTMDLKETSAFPNPAKTEVTITYELEKNDSGYLNIYNQSGAVVKTLTVKRMSNSITVDISDLPKGIYLYEIRSPKNQKISYLNKIVIN